MAKEEEKAKQVHTASIPFASPVACAAPNSSGPSVEFLSLSHSMIHGRKSWATFSRDSHLRSSARHTSGEILAIRKGKSWGFCWNARAFLSQEVEAASLKPQN